jgi:transcriptional regulator with XRE-family HTH domain
MDRVVVYYHYAVPPGETLLETLDAMGMSQAELAERTGMPIKIIKVNVLTAKEFLAKIK